ncbi:hypothetical protein ACVINZ_006182 [Mesorhizobium jarvisii]
MFEPPPSSVIVERRDRLFIVIVYEDGQRTEYGPFNEEAAEAKAIAERRRLGL